MPDTEQEAKAQGVAMLAKLGVTNAESAKLGKGSFDRIDKKWEFEGPVFSMAIGEHYFTYTRTPQGAKGTAQSLDRLSALAIAQCRALFPEVDFGLFGERIERSASGRIDFAFSYYDRDFHDKHGWCTASVAFDGAGELSSFSYYDEPEMFESSGSEEGETSDEGDAEET